MEEIPSARALLLSAFVLLLSLGIVGTAIFGISRSGFWNVAPVILKRGLDR